MISLGKLEKVKDLRSVWKNETQDFTNWLAKKENLQILNNELGIDIELISTEAKTGSFNTDILARNLNTNNKIVIENQLESSDHDHLGKIITYASGHDAKTIIWIVKEAREEHRQAIDQLNEHTDEEINIFLCKIELWKIDNSPIAPKFQIISQPNRWTKIIKRTVKDNMTSTEMLQYNYQTKVSEEINNNYPTFNSKPPQPQYDYDLPIGTSSAHISLHIVTRNNEVRSLIRIYNKKLYNNLLKSKDEIEKEIGLKLNWKSLEKNKSSTISIVKKFNIKDENTWNEAIKWQLDMAKKLYNAFHDKIKKFN